MGSESMETTVLTCYTPDNGYYETAVSAMRKQCAELGMPFEAIEYECLGSWLLNCRAKPQLVYNWMVRHPGRSVFFVDADAIIKADLSDLDDVDCDIAFVPSHHGRDLYVYAGCYLVKTARGIEFLQQWADACVIEQEGSDHRALCRVLPDAEARINVVKLPRKYCTMQLESSTLVLIGISKTILKNQWKRSLQ
jgi:hypothetical protein